MTASEYRAKRAQATQNDPTGEITLPSGAVFVCRRPPLQVWVAAGKIPQSFLSKMRTADPEAAAEQMSDAENLAAIKFVRDAILYAVVEPKLEPGTTDPEKLDPADLDPEDFTFLSKWIMSGCPGVPVATKGGEVAIDNLTRFRQKRPGGGAPNAGSDGAEVRDEAEPNLAAAG